MTYAPDRLRAATPALASGVAFFDGPGGTQMPQPVIDVMAAAMQAGLSNRGRLTVAARHADDITVAARQACADLLGADPRGIVFGRSATEITFQIARTLAASWGPDDDIIVTQLDHDANVRPWVRYAEVSGATVRWAQLDPATGDLPADAVTSLLSDRTRVVAVTAASNVIGTRPDLAAISRIVRAAGALFYVDGVHATAHVPIDCSVADFWVCSPYKFLGPHLGVLAASPALLETLHPDKLRPSPDAVPERFELGTLPYELLAGVVAAIDVIADLVPGDETSMNRRERILRSMLEVEHYETGVVNELRSGLEQLPGVRFYGNAPLRTPTEFFSFAGHDSAGVAQHLADHGINAPASNFYAIETCDALGLGAAGAVRAGLAAYTTREDVDRLLAALADIVGT
ncbi:MAG: cysteine desulfurase-like protein [Actinobacteria bacterium]|nr:cysteine desulfurase-like protein [Actinomycetota bacterium]